MPGCLQSRIPPSEHLIRIAAFGPVVLTGYASVLGLFNGTLGLRSQRRNSSKFSVVMTGWYRVRCQGSLTFKYPKIGALLFEYNQVEVRV